MNRGISQLAKVVLVASFVATGVAWLAIIAVFASFDSGGIFGSRPAEPGPPRPANVVFDEWQSISDFGEREAVAREIIRDGHLVGMAKADVQTKLGEGAYGPGWAAYGDLKYRVAPNGLDDLWLCVFLDDAGVVNDVLIRSD